MHRLSTLVLATLAAAGSAADWPQFRHDAARSGFAPEPLSAELSLQWVYQPMQPPDAAWVGHDTRLPFDHAPHAVVANAMLFFGSSADCKVYALDVGDGSILWSYDASIPVEAPPLIAGGSVYIGSVDGVLLSLDLETGRKKWSYATEGRIAGAANVDSFTDPNVVIVGSYDSKLHAIGADTGRRIPDGGYT